MHIDILRTSSAEFRTWLDELPMTPVVVMLLAGDRLTCCDEVAVCKVKGEIVSVATIAPEGEQMSGQPTIVALYTPSEYRRKGYGTATFCAAVERCLERGFEKIRVDILSTGMEKTVDRLPEDLRAHLDAHDMGKVLDWIED